MNRRESPYRLWLLLLALGCSMSLALAFLGWFHSVLVLSGLLTIVMLLLLLQMRRRAQGYRETLINSSQTIAALPWQKGDEHGWHALAEALKNVLNCDGYQLVEGHVNGVALKDNARVMVIELSSTLYLELSFLNSRRWFRYSDISLIAVPLSMGLLDRHRRSAYAIGQTAVHKRVAQDLHDRIGARLHALAYGSPVNQNAYIQRTINELMLLTESFERNAVRFFHFAEEANQDIRQHCEAFGVELMFQTVIEPEIRDSLLNEKAASHLLSIFHELSHNALKHRQVTRIEVRISANKLGLSLRMKNNGEHTQPDQWVGGLGLISVRRRVNDLAGQISWLALSSGGVEVRLACDEKIWIERE